MTAEFIFYQSKVFEISFSEALVMRKNFLNDYIQKNRIILNDLKNTIVSENSYTVQLLFKDYFDKILNQTKKYITELKSYENINFKKLKSYIPIDFEKANLCPVELILGQPVRKFNNEWLYRSPFREDKNPSFAVNIQKNLWHDWGTGEGGNIIELYMKLNNTNVANAAKQLSSMF